MSRAWTVESVRALGVTTDLVTAGSVLGLSRNVSYQLAAAGDFPVRLLRLGARYRVAVAALLRLLEIEVNDGDPDAPATLVHHQQHHPLETSVDQRATIAAVREA